MSDHVCIQPQEVVDVVIYAVHVQDEVYLLGRHQEALPIVKGYARLHKVVNEYFLIKSLIVDTVAIGFHVFQLLSILIHQNFGCLLFKRYLYELIIP